MSSPSPACSELAQVSVENSGADSFALEHESIFEFRREKGYAAAAAIADVLQRRRALNGGEDEFLSIWRWMRHQGVTTEIYSDPYFYYWSRMAFQLLGLHLGTLELVPSVDRYLKAIGITDIAEAMLSHLEQFKSFAIGRAWEARATLMFERPFVVQLPWAMPISPWSLDGSETCAVRGIRGRDALCVRSSDGECDMPLQVANNRAKFGELELCRAPHVGNGDFAILMQPHCLNMPGMGKSLAEFSRIGTEFQWQSKDRLECALAVIQKVSHKVYTPLTSLMKNFILKPETVGNVFNTSCSRLTGLSIITCYESPYVLAEDLIHEFNHNVLFALEDQGSFFEESDIDPVNDQQFYSPWREDPRPIYGLFHACFVFTRVADFWCDVLVDPTIDDLHREYARGRVALLEVQLQLVDQQLTRFANLTALGQDVLAATRDCRKRIQMVVEQESISTDMPAMKPQADGSFVSITDSEGFSISIRQECQNHMAAWDVFDRCRSQSFLDKQ